MLNVITNLTQRLHLIGWASKKHQSSVEESKFIPIYHLLISSMQTNIGVLLHFVSCFITFVILNYFLQEIDKLFRFNCALKFVWRTKDFLSFDCFCLLVCLWPYISMRNLRLDSLFIFINLKKIEVNHQLNYMFNYSHVQSYG